MNFEQMVNGMTFDKIVLSYVAKAKADELSVDRIHEIHGQITALLSMSTLPSNAYQSGEKLLFELDQSRARIQRAEERAAARASRERPL